MSELAAGTTSRPVADGEESRSDESDTPSRTRVSALRAAYSLLGVGIAVGAAATMEASSRSVYVAYFFLALVLQFVWLGSRFPFALPYYTAMNAFAYIAGPPVVTLEYAQRLISYPALAWLARRGWMSLPPPLEPVLGEAESGRRSQAWIDHGTAGTLAAFGVLLRYGIFVWLQSTYEFGLIPAIAVAEFATLAFLGALHALMPLPMTEALRLGGVLRWRLDDERVDLIVVVILVAPLFVFVINLAWALEGLPAAIGFSLATLGPHLLMKLSNDRLGRVEGLLESKQQELKDLVHTVAHDLKSPISSALLTTDLVLDRDGSAVTNETRSDLERVVRLLSRAEDMVRDLLRLFRIVWEPEKVSEVDLDRTIAVAIEAIQPKVSARGARIEISPLPRIWGQAVKLEHAFSNLLENALKYLPEGGGVIGVEARVDSSATLICVRDNGCGIPADYHHRIFELYSRVPRPGERQSSGVGLAIVKRVVEAHGGRVWVESEIGSGSCFFVWLPSVIPNADEVRVTEASPFPRGPTRAP